LKLKEWKRERIAAMKVLCTNGLKTVMLDLAPAFERTSGTKLTITWGSAAGLVKELEAGAAADLVILAAEAIDDLIKRGKVVAGSRVDLARSGIGIAVRKGASKPDIGSPDALKQTLLAARSVAHSKTGERHLLSDRAGAARHRRMQSKIVMPGPERRSATSSPRAGPRSASSRSVSCCRSRGTSSARCRRHCRRSRRFPPAFPRPAKGPMP
jgi:hypothetical protein